MDAKQAKWREPFLAWTLGTDSFVGQYSSARNTASPEISPDNHVPERKLIAAVLTRAVQDICNPANPIDIEDAKKAAEDTRDARRWLASNQVAEYSFLWCCEALSLDPSGLRRRVKLALADKKAGYH